MRLPIPSRCSLPDLKCWLLLVLSMRGDIFAAEPEVLHVPEPTAEAFVQVLHDLRQMRADGNTDPVVIRLQPGVYRLSKTIVLDVDIVGRGLTIEGEAEGVVLTGAKLLPTPTRDAEGNWRTHLPELPEEWGRLRRPSEFMIDGTLRTAARFPNEGYHRIEEALEDRRSGFKIRTENLPDIELTPFTSCHVVLMHDWSSSRLQVKSINPNTGTLTTHGPLGAEAKHYAIDHFEKQPRYYLEGHPAFADQPGEWFLNTRKGEIVIVGDAAAEGKPVPPVVELPWLSELVRVAGTKGQPIANVKLHRLEFTGARFPMPPGGYAGSQATMHEARKLGGRRDDSGRVILPAAVQVEHADGFEAHACRFTQLGPSGLWVGKNTHNGRVSRCVFDAIGGNALNIGEDKSRRVQGKGWIDAAPETIPSGHLVDRCEVNRCGQMMPGAVGIWAPFVRKTLITNNHIHDCPYTGISLGWQWNARPTPSRENHIIGNRIEFVMQTLSDGAGIYTLGNQPLSKIEGNIITDVPLNAGRAESNGIFCDQGTSGFTIANNTIRRIDRSPIRFHQAGRNLVKENRWELATPQTPPVRFNNTLEANIVIRENEVLKPERRIMLIGNSLTWDTVPSRLDEAVHWHVDCGKPLTYIHENPASPCVDSSRIWPTALTTAKYDVISVQPHYRSTLEGDVEVISEWMAMQPKATFVLHTGWAFHGTAREERADESAEGPMTHSDVYFNTLRDRLRKAHPDRTILTTDAMRVLWTIEEDIAQGTAPIEKLSDLYRDKIHMTLGPGRYLMHNVMRQTLGQPRTSEGFPEFDPKLKTYLDTLLDGHRERQRK